MQYGFSVDLKQLVSICYGP